MEFEHLCAYAEGLRILLDRGDHFPDKGRRHFGIVVEQQHIGCLREADPFVDAAGKAEVLFHDLDPDLRIVFLYKGDAFVFRRVVDDERLKIIGVLQAEGIQAIL